MSVFSETSDIRKDLSDPQSEVSRRDNSWRKDCKSPQNKDAQRYNTWRKGT